MDDLSRVRYPLDRWKIGGEVMLEPINDICSADAPGITLPPPPVAVDCAVIPHWFSCRGAPQSKLALESPTLVILGGRDATSREIAEKLCGYVSRELEVPADVPVFSAFYQGTALEDERFQQHLAEYYQRGAESNLAYSTAIAARSIIESQLAHLIPDLRDVTCPTERETALRVTSSRFGNLTLFGFSLGSIIFNAMDRELQRALAERGYAPQESARIRQHLAMMTVGDVAFGGIQNAESDATWVIPTIHIASTHDIFARPTLSGFISDENQTSDAPIRVSYVRGRKRIAIIVPVARTWQHGGRVDHELVEGEDPTGHTPPVYLKPKISSEPNSLFVPVMVRSLLHTMFDSQQRPCEAVRWLGICQDRSPLGGYYSERFAQLRGLLSAARTTPGPLP